jgi:excisionase family DNA binding protein
VTHDPFAPEPADAPRTPSVPTPPDPLLVDAVTAARLLGISRTTLDSLVRKGEIRRVKLAGRVLFSTELLRRIAGGEA